MEIIISPTIFKSNSWARESNVIPTGPSIEFSIDNKCINITLEVDESNEAAINLYKKYGFTIAAIRKKYYGKNDGYLMIREMV